MSQPKLMVSDRARRVPRRAVPKPTTPARGYPLPPNEAARMRALRRLAILDTPPEPAYDRITRLAQSIFGVAVSTVALIDDERQWFKSCIGADTKETGRDVAFCAHAILADEVLVVPDATKDPRFRENALVTGPPHIRFYAGAPLKTADGFFVGTLCIIDMKPRAFSKEDAAILADLAAVLTDEFSRRNAVLELRDEVLRSQALAKSLRTESDARQRAARDLEAILDALPAEVALLGQDGTIIAVNKAWRSFGEANGLKAPDAGVGTNYFAICGAAKGRHSEEASAAETGLRATLDGSLAEYCLEYPCHSPTEKRWFRMIAAPLQKGMEGAVVMHIDITARQQAEADRAELNKQLVAASRRAGMADVATSVLHNVGNVLNSVNVSATLASGKIRASSSGQVRKVADLLLQNSGDLPAYLATAQGTKLPAFLGTLAARLDEEQQAVLGELESLSSNIDHIKSVVTTQQAFARVGGVMEEVSPTALVEDALKLDEASLKRHGVEVIRDYAETPLVPMDKHKTLEILLNLIRNAKQAIGAMESTESRRLTIGVSHDENAVTITVADEGVGIAAENVTRIFAHGFTTRADGHGFGLHSAATSAQEMGGSLSVTSDGVGHGATFKLTLPLQRKES